MVQIIGFLGCLYLFLKGCEFVTSKNYSKEDGESQMDGANAAATIAFIGSLVFAAWLFFQGQGVGDITSTSGLSSSSAYEGMNVDNLLADNLIVNDTTGLDQ